MKFTEELPEIKAIISNLSKYFDRDRIEQEARSCKFIQRPKKLTGFAFFIICVTESLENSLSILCCKLSEFSIYICEQSLNERFTDNAVAFVKRMFEQILALELIISPPMNFLRAFSGVFIQDATVINLPDTMSHLFKGMGGSSGKSSLKIDFQMDVQNTSCQVNLRGGSSSDNIQAVENPKPGALYIRDLGYFNISLLGLITEAKAYFLSRLKPKIAIYEDERGKKTFDIGNASCNLVPNEIIHKSVFIGRRKYLPVNLIIQKLPAEIVAIKVAKLKKSCHQRMMKVSQEALAWCQINTYITNIPLNWFDALVIIEIYGIRWQIEIIFKVWKSIFKINEVGKMNSNRILCMLYGRLVFIMLNMKIFRVFKKNIYGVSQKELSELGAFKQMNEQREKFKLAIRTGLYEMWKELISFFFRAVQSFAIKKIRAKDLSPLYNTHFKCNTLVKLI